ncbi:hypothetical protein V8C34DRAFT_278041 [Trichoderma compactum]
MRQPRSVYPCLLPPTRAQMPRSAPKLVGHQTAQAQKLHAPRFDSVRRSGMEGCVIYKCVPSTALGRLSPCRLSSAVQVHTILCYAVEFFRADLKFRLEWVAGRRGGGGLFWRIRVRIVSHDALYKLSFSSPLCNVSYCRRISADGWEECYETTIAATTARKTLVGVAHVVAWEVLRCGSHSQGTGSQSCALYARDLQDAIGMPLSD